MDSSFKTTASDDYRMRREEGQKGEAEDRTKAWASISKVL
jgi:hypothetical protein